MTARNRDKDQTPAPSAIHKLLPVITQVAFVMVLALVVARCTFLETLRDPIEVIPGAKAYPLGPGAATSLILDLMCCIPAILILTRRLLDKGYLLRWSWSQVLLVPLLAWMALSIRWASDQFAAMVSVCNVIAAFTLFWSAAQLVRSWLRLHIVAAVCFGLLLVLVANGFYFKFVEAPDTRIEFEKEKKVFLQQQGWNENDFAAKQFEKKVMEGELLGFSASSNSLAAMLVLLMLICAGLTIQRIINRDPGGWAVALALAAVLAVPLLAYTHSKAALVAPFLGAMIFLAVWILRRKLAEKSTALFWMGVGILLLVIAAVVGHGLYHHSLPTASLNFRWRYWIATLAVFHDHPIRGVGWANFGLYYNRYRLPIASEEIKDPHDFILRFFVELGAVGGILMLAWMMRLWWEMTRPITPVLPLLTTPRPKTALPPDPQAAASGVVTIGYRGYDPISTGNKRKAEMFGIVAVAVAALVINAVCSIDFSEQTGFITIELMKRVLWLCALILGILIASLRSVENPTLDQRPAPWVLYGILVGLGIFLIHNLIEFSFFEPGSMCLFALLAGAGLGMRQPAVVWQTRRPVVAGGAFAIAVAGWIAALIFVVIPTVIAEDVARAGDDALRNGQFVEASQDYQAAYFGDLPYFPINADYAFRAGRALHYGGEYYTHNKQIKLPPGWEEQARSLYSIAAGKNPKNVSTYLALANLALLFHKTDEVIVNYDKALTLDPNEVSIRLEYASALQELDRPALAKSQLELALHYDSLLDHGDGLTDAGDPKQLSPGKIKQIQKQIESLK